MRYKKGRMKEVVLTIAQAIAKMATFRTVRKIFLALRRYWPLFMCSQKMAGNPTRSG